MRTDLATALLASAALALAACPDGAATPPCDAGQDAEVLQPPVAGLSIVESFPATPESVTLGPNPALVDGDRTASAGVNLGTAAGAGPTIDFRDLGAQLADTTVDRIDVYVGQDGSLTPALVAAFAWAAYRSEDNVQWTGVALRGPAAWSAARLRFEIPIERTQARYLKVVTRPLASAATQDPRHSEILVTELQLVEHVPVFCPLE